MYMFGFINLIGLIACIFGLPSSLNQTVSDDEVIQYENQIGNLGNADTT